MAPLILAHQGGWDEALMVLVPIGLFASVLLMANRRAERVRSERERASEDQFIEPTDDGIGTNETGATEIGN
jgi:hypothetical protein